MRSKERHSHKKSTVSEHQQRLMNLVSYLDPFLQGRRSLDIIDIGGTELSEDVLAQRFPDSRITVLNTKIKPAKIFVFGDAQAMPFDSETFDLMICIELIEHVYNPQKVFSEAHRIGRDKSLLLVTTPNMNAWYNRVLVPLGFMPANYTVIPYRQYGNLFPVNKKYVTGQDHCRIFNLQSLVQAMQEQGFDILKTFGVNYSESGHRFSILRKCMERVMRNTLCENIGVVASKADIAKQRL